MRKIWFIILTVAIFSILTACTGTSKETVLKKLDAKLQDVTSYKMEAEMKMHTGKDVRSYDVEVLYKKEEADHFKVTLNNKAEKTGQIILKNEQGVFVLTPDVNKTFKFQSDWPENSSQPYLYQSIVRDVTEDEQATFTEMEDYYMFEAKTNYEHQSNLPYQEIYLDKKSLLPKAVHILDEEKNLLIEVLFSHTETNVAMEEETFDKDILLENMTSTKETDEEDVSILEVQYPLETFGSELMEEKEVPLDEGKRIIMTFAGEHDFTFIQENEVIHEQPMTEAVYGEMVELGDVVAAVSNNTIEWTKDGVHYYLASETMTTEQLQEVAQSTTGKSVK